MNRIRFGLLLLALLLVPAAASTAALSDYLFDAGTGTRADTTGATTIWRGVGGSGGIANAVVTLDLPFAIAFDYRTYTRISISSNGVIGLGDSIITTSPANDLDATTNPTIAPWWDQLRVAGGGGGTGSCWTPRVSWVVTGSEPNRVFVVDYDNVELVRIQNAPTRGQFQVRFHEADGRIEFWYGRMTPCGDCGAVTTCASTSASIGIAGGEGNFISVMPDADTATTDMEDADDALDLNDGDDIAEGTLYSFTPGFRRLALSSNGFGIDESTPLFAQQFSCVGEAAMSVPVTIHNPGSLPMTVSSIDLFRLDTFFNQGIPSLHLLRDARDRAVATSDYIVTNTPGGAPMPVNTPLATPIVVAPGGTRTFYVTFVGQIAGRRYARMFVRSDASGVTGIDTNFFDFLTPQTMTEGLIAVDLFAEGVGAWFAATPEGLKIQPVIFPDTRAGDTSFAELVIANAGGCDLRINRRLLRIFSGDVHEFAIVRRFASTTFDPVTGDDILGVGMRDTMRFRFTPVRSGTRLATLFIQTNDSSRSLPGISERGAYYVDLFGRGRAGLDARRLVLRPVIVGSFVNGVVVLENSSIAAVDIASIGFSGGDSAEFAQDPTNPWPTNQIRVLGGGTLSLGVRMTPTGLPGVRRTTMIIVTTTGDTARVPISGEAGVQQLVIAPTSLFENITVPIGSSIRRTVSISNLGTLPIRLQMPVLSGPDSANYILGKLPRLDLEPGQTEFLEVTFAPAAAGQSSAEITFSSNAGPDQVVTLGGDALRTDGGDDEAPPTQIATGLEASSPIHYAAGRGRAPRTMMKQSIDIASGGAAVPNPAATATTIGFHIERAARVSATLFDAAGRFVAPLFDGEKGSGEHALDVACGELAPGAYLVRIESEGATRSIRFVVAR